MATSTPKTKNPIHPHPLARHWLGRNLLRTPESAFLVVGLLWFAVYPHPPLGILPIAVIGPYFIARWGLLQQSRRHFNQGRYHEATEDAALCARLNPFSVEAYWLLGISALYRNRPQIAVDYLYKACRLDPTNPQLYAALAAALLIAEQPEAAMQHAQYAMQLQPTVFTTLVLSDCAATQEQVAHLLRSAIPYTRQPADRAILYCALANHLIETDRRTEAITFLAQALWLARACPPATRGPLHYRLGELLWQCGEHDMARNQFRASLEIDPHGPYAAQAWRAAIFGLDASAKGLALDTNSSYVLEKNNRNEKYAGLMNGLDKEEGSSVIEVYRKE
ncbi:MAG: hypothetical protein K6356_07410 [Chloroflexus sp.]